MRRRRWFMAITLVFGLLAVAGWAYFRPPAVRALGTSEIQTVEVRFEPRSENRATSPGASSADPEAIAELRAVLSSGVESSDHKCSSCGVITLRRSSGLEAELEFLPGHQDEWYELRYSGALYRVPREKFVTAMRRVGVEVPMQCH